MNNDISEKVVSILKSHALSNPDTLAKALREFWLQFEPNKGIELIKAEQRTQYEAIGIPIPVLKAIGKELAKSARQNVESHVPLAQLLWDHYGREGRVVALLILGAMELVKPEKIVPLLRNMCRACLSWEDADRLAMDAVEPIVRKYPDKWLSEMEAWLKDENKWVRRASVTIIGRLPMKHPAYTHHCLELTEQLLTDKELDVKRAVSFAIRMCAKTDAGLVYDFLQKQMPASNPAAVWVLSDVIKSMGKKILIQFKPLLPNYENWRAAPHLDSKDRRSIESAIQVLRTA